MATALPILDIHAPGTDLARKTVFIKLHLGLLGNDHVNIIYSHPGDQAQLAASEAVWQKVKEAESKRNQQPNSA